jgi:6-phospho-3-hexuloisomerase
MNAVEVALAEIDELKEMLSKTKPEQTKALAGEIAGAKRIFIGGAGRSLLSMRGFAMRLMQTGFTTYLVGEVCTPSIQSGDLLFVASGRGTTSVTLELVRKAKAHGARTAVITMNEDAPIPKECDCVLVLPRPSPDAPNDSAALSFAKKNLPGNFPEAVIMLSLDGVIADLMERGGLTGEIINKNHANLE